MTTTMNLEIVATTIAVMLVIVSLFFPRETPAQPEETEQPKKPECFASEPHPVDIAERDCHTCPWGGPCAAQWKFTARQRARDAARQSSTDPFIPVSLLPRD